MRDLPLSCYLVPLKHVRSRSASFFFLFLIFFFGYLLSSFCCSSKIQTPNVKLLTLLSLVLHPFSRHQTPVRHLLFFLSPKAREDPHGSDAPTLFSGPTLGNAPDPFSSPGRVLGFSVSFILSCSWPSVIL